MVSIVRKRTGGSGFLRSMIAAMGLKRLGAVGSQSGTSQITDAQDTAEEMSFAKYLAKADEYRDQREWNAAANFYQLCVNIDPSRNDIYVQLGNMQKESANYDAALLNYNESLRLDPKNADTYLQIGHCLKLAHRYPDAIHAYEMSLRLDPTLPDPYHEIRHVNALRQQTPSPETASAGQHEMPPPRSAAPIEKQPDSRRHFPRRVSSIITDPVATLRENDPFKEYFDRPSYT